MRRWIPTIRQARRLVVAVIGSTVLLIGIALLVVPGPGWAVIFLGLAVLGTEFAWARRLLHHTREMAGRAKEKLVNRTRR